MKGSTGARARRGTGNEPKRKRAREDGNRPTKRLAAEPPRSGRNTSPLTRSIPSKPYEPTPQEREVVQAYRARAKSKAAVPAITVGEGKDLGKLDFDHPDKAVAACLVAGAVGTNDLDFLGGILVQIANVATKGQAVDATAVNFMLSMVKGVEPRDQIEGMLAAQMAAVHNATMTFARRLNNVENIPQQDSAERAFNKLARTFAAQVEALKRYRSAGEQTVRVEHVTVNEGGQAIVGNVAAGGRGSSQKTEATP
jgi:hypothetical protein